MNGKKILPLFVIASMLLSLTPFAFAAATITTPTASTHYVKGDTIIVTGTGVVAGTVVQLYWDDATIAWNGVKGLANSTTGKSSGAFEVRMKVPESTNGNHYLWIKDASGNTASVVVIVDALVKLSPSTGLPGDTITVSMYGFEGTNKLVLSLDAVQTATPTTNSVGTVITTFKVPTSAGIPSSIIVKAENATLVMSAQATLTVGPVITLSPSIGTVGSVVAITGRGFTPTGTIAQGDVQIDGVACYITTTLPITVDATGRIRLNAVIAETPAKDTYTLAVGSLSAGTASTDFEVTGLPSASVSPSYGPVASSIVISGVNFPKISGVDVVITMGAASIGTAKTLADGTFSKSFIVPAATEGPYTITAASATYNIDATKGFKVGTMNIILSANSGATGKTVSISGNGFTHSGAWNATFGSETVVGSGAADANGLLVAGTFQVPQLPIGTYTITVWDETADIQLTTQFQITQTTQAVFSVPSAPTTFNVTIRGKGFSDVALGAVSFVIYNKTSTGALDFWWNMGSVNPAGTAYTYVTNLKNGVGPSVSNSTGEFYGYWNVDSVLSKGAYYINVTDATGNYKVTVPFTVGDVHIVATPRKESFKVGETISFLLEHSFKAKVMGSTLKIYNPSGSLIFSGDALNTWTQTGLWFTAPYSTQTASGNLLTLSDDAPIGAWSWKWNNAAGDNIKSGNFTVVASDVAATDAKITALATQITGLSTAITGLQTAATAAGTKADAATAAATAAGAKSDAATAAATAAGTKADAAATAAAAAAASAKSAADGVSGLTTLVYAAIGASLIAALAAIVALMQISRKIA